MAINISFVKYYKIYYLISGILVAASIFSLVIFGLRFSIDFLGGSILEVELENRPANSVVQDKLNQFDLGEITTQPTGERGLILRLKSIDEATHQQILSSLNEISKTEEKRFESIGPTIGKELRGKTLLLMIVSLVSLLIYIAIAFRKISGTISSWQYGVISIVTLAFDVLIPISAFALLGKIYNIQVNIPIIAALLTILGYTINDKVIVFDRIRENLLRSREENFEELVNQSLNQILGRSLSTGVCTLLVLIALFLLGGETLKYFAFILIVGIVVGTYSSLFIASPLLVSWTKWRMGKKG